ncbi:MAG: RNA polymerase sigma factor [Chloroflexota bacterium]|nr:RNA polymerase sigma factor [Chloroflexota bacterium]
MEEADLIARAKEGDTDALSELVRNYQELVFRTAYLITHDAAEAEDAAQEAFIKAYRALPRFRHGAPLRPWLLRIVVNEARNRRRSAGRRLALAQRLFRSRPSADAAPSVEWAVLATENARALLEALGRLPERDRLIIHCRYFLDLPEAELAEVLGVPRGTVKSRLSRATAKLRSELGVSRNE